MLRGYMKSIIYGMLRHIIMFKNPTVKIKSRTKIKGKTIFGGWNRIGENCEFTGSIGKYSYMGDNCKLNAKIGNFCSIASNVHILTATHPITGFVSIHPAFYSTAKQCGTTFVEKGKFNEYKYIDPTHKISCELGNDVWICENVMIVGGVRIGDGSIIAAGAVVTKDVPDFTIVGGIPAKIIGKRFDDKTIEELKKVEWWYKSDKWLKSNANEFDDIVNISKWSVN